jgi:hypothetical protein
LLGIKNKQKSTKMMKDKCAAVSTVSSMGICNKDSLGETPLNARLAINWEKGMSLFFIGDSVLLPACF